MDGSARHRSKTTWWLLLFAALAWTGLREARAAEPCDIAAPPAATWGARVAAVACAEHRLWYSPFVDEQGRLASISVTEAEDSQLNDNATPAWKRVVDYWKGTGLLYSANGRQGASNCGVGFERWPGSAMCRAFVVDTPWSAVFVSFAYMRAGIPGFAASTSHYDFLRQALHGGPASPLRYANPDVDAPAVGDLLCFTRGQSEPLGPVGMRAYMERNGGNIAMHCDIVVAIDDGKLYAVGGNVLQGVTLRTLHVNRNGTLWNLQRRGAIPSACRPAASAGCSFNRQDWVALLKLEPKAPPPAPMQNCCTLCPLPMPPGVQRCPVVPPPLTPPASPSTTAPPPAHIDHGV